MSIRNPRVAALLAAGALAAGLAGCAPASQPPSAAASSSGTAPQGAGQLSGTVTVFAAASLKATFTKLAGEFEAKNPGTKVTLSFAGSSDLVTQITQGAPADVFASADTKNMAKLSDAKLIDGTAANFATNVLEIAVPPSNPASIASFADLAKPGVKVVVCASQVPAAPRRTPSKRPPAPPCHRSARNPPSPTSWARSPPVRPTPAWSTSPTSRAPAAR